MGDWLSRTDKGALNRGIFLGHASDWSGDQRAVGRVVREPDHCSLITRPVGRMVWFSDHWLWVEGQVLIAPVFKLKRYDCPDFSFSGMARNLSCREHWIPCISLTCPASPDSKIWSDWGIACNVSDATYSPERCYLAVVLGSRAANVQPELVVI